MHEFKLYKLTHTTGSAKGKIDYFNACCKCGRIRHTTMENGSCSGTMHSNCNVKALNMVLVPDPLKKNYN